MDDPWEFPWQNWEGAGASSWGARSNWIRASDLRYATARWGGMCTAPRLSGAHVGVWQEILPFTRSMTRFIIFFQLSWRWVYLGIQWARDSRGICHNFINKFTGQWPLTCRTPPDGNNPELAVRPPSLIWIWRTVLFQRRTFRCWNRPLFSSTIHPVVE